MSRRDPLGTVVLDTNVVIYHQDYAEAPSKEGALASEVQLAVRELGYTAVIADGTLDDIGRGGEREARRRRAVAEFPVLHPGPPGDLARRAGYGASLSVNDDCDLRILAAVDQGMAAWLITNDTRMLRHARRAGLERVLDASEFLSFVEHARHPVELPSSVILVDPADVDIRSPFFSSLTASYPDFGEWWATKVIPDHRTTLVVGEANAPEALAVLKENDADYGLPKDTTKICTFKVSEGARGKRLGELLLRACIQRIRQTPASATFLEVASGNVLVGWAKAFGFGEVDGARAANGDLVLAKYLTAANDPPGLTPWEFHVAHGPGAVRVEHAHLVPIRPEWHGRLFPADDPEAPALFNLTEPCGNAITKVYLSNSPSRKPARGDLLLFVVSGGGQAVTDVGVVEDVLVSDDPLKILRFAGARTVYSASQVRAMCRNGEVHAMAFRHDRRLSPPWNQEIAGYRRLIPSTPQSITEVKEDGIAWLRQHLRG